jgi:hypothetical protein
MTTDELVEQIAKEAEATTDEVYDVLNYAFAMPFFHNDSPVFEFNEKFENIKTGKRVFKRVIKAAESLGFLEKMNYYRWTPAVNIRDEGDSGYDEFFGRPDYLTKEEKEMVPQTPPIGREEHVPIVIGVPQESFTLLLPPSYTSYTQSELIMCRNHQNGIFLDSGNFQQPIMFNHVGCDLLGLYGEKVVDSEAISKKPSILKAEDIEKERRLRAENSKTYEQRCEHLLEISRVPSKYRALAQIMAVENKTKSVSWSRVFTQLYSPLYEVEQKFPLDVFEYAMDVAIKNGAPNANYVKKVASGQKSKQASAADYASFDFERESTDDFVDDKGTVISRYDTWALQDKRYRDEFIRRYGGAE